MATNKDHEFANGWMVVVSAFFVGFITDGLAFSFGVLLIELTDEFQYSIAVITFAGSLTNSFMHLAGPLVGLLSSVISSRTIVIIGALTSFSGFVGAAYSKSIAALSVTYGLLTGVGFCFMFLPANAQVIQHFERKRALAAGISACGSGVGTFINSLLFRYLIDRYTWRGAVLVLSGVILNGVPCGLLLSSRKNNSDHNTPAHTTTGTSDIDSKHALRELKSTVIDNLRLLKDVGCISMLISTFLVNLAYSVPSILLPDQAVTAGMTKVQGTWLVSSMGISGILGRGFCGWVADYKFVNKTVMFESTLVLAGLSTALSPFLETFETKLLYTCLYGFLIGGFVVLIPVVLADMFGPDLIEKSYGLVMLAVGIPCLFAAPLGGWLFETTGSFTVTYVVAGTALALGGLAILLPVCCKLKRFEYERMDGS